MANGNPVLRHRHDVKSAINALKMLAEIFESGLELTPEEKIEIAKKLRQSHAVLEKEFTSFLEHKKFEDT